MTLRRDHCGTTTGYKYHHSRYDEPACQACKDAHAKAARDRKARRRAELDTLAPPEPDDTRRKAGIADCGTDSGYYRHIRVLKEDACHWCKDAHNKATRTRAQRIADKKRREAEAKKARQERLAAARVRRRSLDYQDDHHASQALGHPDVLRTVRISEYLLARLWDTADTQTLAQLDAELGTAAVDHAVDTYPDRNDLIAHRAAQHVQALAINARRHAA